MRAVDTNILARFYLRDDPVQGRIAAGVLSAGDVFIPKTVILELEWVLRYVADQSESKVIECLEHLIALPGITVEDRDEIEAALGHCRKGIDFADALHLAASKPATSSLRLMTGVTRGGRESFASNHRSWCRRANACLRLQPAPQRDASLLSGIVKPRAQIPLLSATCGFLIRCSIVQSLAA